MGFNFTFRADDIEGWDADTSDLVENRDRELELYSTTIDDSFLNLNASNLTLGTVPSARLTGSYTGVTGLGDLGSLVVTGNTSTDLVRITQTGTGNALVVEDSTNPDATPFVVDANGRVVTGNTSAIAIGLVIPQIQASSTTASGSAVASLKYSADTAPPRLQLAKSRDATVGSHTAVAVGDELGRIDFYGSDGTGFKNTAAVHNFAEGTISTGIVPSNLRLSTANASGVVTERMRIDSSGQVGINNQSPTTALDVTGTVKATQFSGGSASLTGLTSSGQINVSRGALGTALNNELTFINPTATTSNGEQLDTRLIRTTAGTDWTTAAWRMGRLVDTTRMGFIQFGSFNVQFGTGTTVYGTVNTSGFSGAGSGLTSLNATQLTSGTVPSARISGAYSGFTSITVDGANSPSFLLGDWNAGTYSGITGNTGYLLVGANNGDVNVYFRAAGASGTVNLGGAGVDTLKIGNGTMLQIGNTALGANNTYQCAALPAFGFNAWAGVSSYNFYNASDIRYKANVKQLPLGLNFIKLLNPIEFTYIYPEFGEDSDTPTSTTEGIRLRAGLSAQNVKESLLAVGAGDYNLWALADKNNQNSFQALDYTGFIAPIIRAIQELDARLEQLETK